MFQERFFAIIGVDHPLANRDHVSLDDLRDERFTLLVSDYSEHGWEAIKTACALHGFEPKPYPIVVNNPIDFMTASLEGSVLILQRGFVAGNLAFDPRYRAVEVSDTDAFFTVNAYYRAEDRDRVKPLLKIFEDGVASLRGASPAPIPSAPAKAPFRQRCDALAQRAKLNESERSAMVSFAKGRSIDRISQELGLSRTMTGDLLASVYQKVGVSDRQDLIDAIEQAEVG